MFESINLYCIAVGALYIIINLFYYVLKMFLFCCLASLHGENVSVQHNGGFLLGVILLTQCYYYRGTRLNAMKRFCIADYYST